MKQILIATLILSISMWGQTSHAPKLAITIEKTTPTKFGYNISIRVRNTSPAAVHLIRSAALGMASSKLQSLDVQQWDEKLGWESVGPCRDVVSDSLLTLSSQQDIEDLVPIGDIAHGWRSSVCPRKIEHLGGKIRAVVYCVYRSEQEFKNRMQCKDCCAPTVSPSIDLTQSP